MTTPKCAGFVRTRAGYRYMEKSCTRGGLHEHEGKNYCSQHHPGKKVERRAAADKARQSSESESFKRTRMQFYAEEVLLALEGLMEWEYALAVDLRLHTNPEPLIAAAKDAIAKARGTK